MSKPGYVYILASQRNGTLYVGVTSDLIGRISAHRTGSIPGFTAQYGVKTLVYYEMHTDIEAAIRREKAIKQWRREWKLNLIQQDNLAWRDLYTELFGEGTQQ